MSKKDKKTSGTHNEFPMYDDMCVAGTVSSADCTGMVPSGNINSEEEFRKNNRLHKFSEAEGKNKI